MRDALTKAVAEHELAAILCEPIAANMGLVPPAEGFLELLREQADASGALLVFDEVITGFRVARGGAQERYGVQPDLAIMGKVLGGGLPLAAYGGRRELMSMVAPAGDVYQAGTLTATRWRSRPGSPRCRSWTPPPTSGSASSPNRLASGLRDAAGDRPVHGRLGARPRHPVLLGGAGQRLHRRRGL